MKRTPEQVIWDFVQSWLRKAAVEFHYPGDETTDHEVAQQALDEAKRIQAGIEVRHVHSLCEPP